MSQSKRVFAITKYILWVSIPAWLIIVGLMLWLEPMLVYPGAPSTRGDYEPDFEFEDVDFRSADGTKLHGWMLPAADSKRYVLFCHGNGENVAMAGGYVARLMGQSLDANVFVFDYRGYGKSAGSPTEKGVVADTHAAMDWLCNRFEIKPTDVIVVGFSIGGGAATDVATGLGRTVSNRRRRSRRIMDLCCSRMESKIRLSHSDSASAYTRRVLPKTRSSFQSLTWITSRRSMRTS